MSNINNEELMELTGENSDYPVFEDEVTCPYCKITQRVRYGGERTQETDHYSRVGQCKGGCGANIFLYKRKFVFDKDIMPHDK